MVSSHLANFLVLFRYESRAVSYGRFDICMLDIIHGDWIRVFFFTKQVINFILIGDIGRGGRENPTESVKFHHQEDKFFIIVSFRWKVQIRKFQYTVVVGKRKS